MVFQTHPRDVGYLANGLEINLPRLEEQKSTPSSYYTQIQVTGGLKFHLQKETSRKAKASADIFPSSAGNWTSHLTEPCP